MGNISEESFDFSITFKGNNNINGNADGYPFKRFHSSGLDLDSPRTKGEFAVKGNKSHLVKSSRNDKIEGFSRKKSIGFWIYSLLVCLLIACFLAEVLLRDTIMVFVNPQEQQHEFRTSDSKAKVFRLPISSQEFPEYFGEAVKFKPSRVLHIPVNQRSTSGTSLPADTGDRHPMRRPRLALACTNLSRNPQLLMLFSVATALQAIGYEVKQLYSLEDGPMKTVWENSGTSVQILENNAAQAIAIDWLNFDGVIISSLEAKKLVTSLMQEPFKEVPIFWIVHESALGARLMNYASNNLTGILNDWKESFHRANLVIFHDYCMPMLYSPLDTGNFYVVPGSPIETWEAEEFMASHSKDEIRLNFGLDASDFVIAVVGSPFIYKGRWLEHMLLMQSILPVIMKFRHIKLCIHGGNSSTYDVALKKFACQLGFPHQSIRHVPDDSGTGILFVSDLIIYGSLREEQGFPSILQRAMSFEKPIIAPNLTIIQKYVVDGKHGILYNPGNVQMLTEAVILAIHNGRLSELACQVAAAGKLNARNIFASDAIVGYAAVLENVLQFPSEAALPFPASEIPEGAVREWQWQLFKDSNVMETETLNHHNSRKSIILEMEEKWNQQAEDDVLNISDVDESMSLVDWVEAKKNHIAEEKEMHEGAELDERTSVFQGTWEDVYRGVKRAERTKDELHERDDGEIERTGQPLCIYEPYSGSGAWPFLHENALYRGIGLNPKGRRVMADDIDAVSRLPLLESSYYRDVLCEYGAYFAIANRVDRIHKNSWIGFQSWRETARKVSLTKIAVKELIDSISAAKHGNAVYFWARMDEDARGSEDMMTHKQDFWSFCDAINAGICRSVFSDSFKRMFDLPEGWNQLPPMPADGDFWSVSHCWAMPTSSFLELVMFARMFVDSLDAKYYEEHYNNGTCCLGISKTQGTHCYCRVLELLVNVWAYHSGRTFIYVNPQTGDMQEQHMLESRRGQMWTKFFNFSTLKAMDEDLAEEADSDHSLKRWLWPNTGEVFWQGIYERERHTRQQLKIIRKRRSREKMERMRGRHRQKSLGRYVKPKPEESKTANLTT